MLIDRILRGGKEKIINDGYLMEWGILLLTQIQPTGGFLCHR